MTEKRFTSCGNNIERDGKLLNIEFKTKTDAKLCCKLCNQMDKHQQEYIDELNEIFKWYKEYYGETILDTRMGWNDNNKISKLEKENEQLKQEIKNLRDFRGFITENNVENEQHRKELQLQMLRLYNYFEDYFEDEMSPTAFSEMWDNVKGSEKWDKKMG